MGFVQLPQKRSRAQGAGLSGAVGRELIGRLHPERRAPLVHSSARFLKPGHGKEWGKGEEIQSRFTLLD